MTVNSTKTVHIETEPAYWLANQIVKNQNKSIIRKENTSYQMHAKMNEILSAVRLIDYLFIRSCVGQ